MISQLIMHRDISTCHTYQKSYH